MATTSPVKQRDAASRTPRSARPLHALDDAGLAAAIAAGDDDAFAVLYDRHVARLLSFSRYLLGSRDEAQDAVQQTFMRAHQALRAGRVPDDVRPWLYAIARNRCRTMLAARAGHEVPVEELEGRASFDGLADEVQRREDLRALVRDMDGLPEDQRTALVLFELGDLSQRDVAGVLEVPEAKVKALVHQARQHLIAEREARDRSCEDVRAELAVARGGELRRGPLRRHLRGCAACRAYQESVVDQRAAIAVVLPVAALAGSRESLFSALGIGGGTAVAAGAGVGAGAVGSTASVAAGGGSASVAAAGGAASVAGTAAAGGALTKLAVTVAAVAAVGGGAAGTRAALDDGGGRGEAPAVTRSETAGPRTTVAPAVVPATAAGTSANSPTAVKPGQTKHARGVRRAAERRQAAAERKAARTQGATAPGRAKKASGAAGGASSAAAKGKAHAKAKPTHARRTKPAKAKVVKPTRTTTVRPTKPAAAKPAPASSRPSRSQATPPAPAPIDDTSSGTTSGATTSAPATGGGGGDGKGRPIIE